MFWRMDLFTPHPNPSPTRREGLKNPSWTFITSRRGGSCSFCPSSKTNHVILPSYRCASPSGAKHRLFSAKQLIYISPRRHQATRFQRALPNPFSHTCRPCRIPTLRLPYPYLNLTRKLCIIMDIPRGLEDTTGVTPFFGFPSGIGHNCRW